MNFGIILHNPKASAFALTLFMQNRNMAKETLEKAKSEALAEYEQNIKSLEQQP